MFTREAAPFLRRRSPGRRTRDCLATPVAASSGRPVHSGPSRSRRGGRDARARRGPSRGPPAGVRLDPAQRTARSLPRASGCPRTPSRTRCRRSWSSLPYRKRDGTARARRAASTPTGPATATPACASTCAAPANPTASWRTSTSQQEQDDALEVIAWIAAQPWCTGKVGMIGISWGGFNGLQIAARRPPALKAIITLLLDRRPLRRRRPLHGRLPAGRQPAALGRHACSHWHLRAAATRRSSASAGASMWLQRLEANQPLGQDLARAPAARRLLEARLGLRGLRRDRDAPSMPSAAGPTATPTPCRACWRA